MIRRAFLGLLVRGNPGVLARWRARVAGQEQRIRWVDPAGLHLTLAFFPALPDEQAAALAGAGPLLVPAGVPAGRQVSLAATPRADGFRSGAGYRVVFAAPGSEHGGWIGDLHRMVRARVAALAPEQEPGVFTPHVTLGRARRDPVPASALPGSLPTLWLDVREVVLLQRVDAGGDHGPYRRLGAWALTPGPTG